VQAAVVEVIADLAASGGSGLVGFIQSGVGTASTSMQSKLRDFISVKDFGAVPGADCTAAFQAAVNHAQSNGYLGIRIPADAQPYIISSTVSIGRLSVIGDGPGSIIRPTITNNTPVLSITAGTNYFELRNFKIDSNINITNFISGGINAQGCIGISVNSNIGTSTYSARFLMRDIFVVGCYVGFSITGFICTLDNIWAINCETGLFGYVLNASRLHLRVENCRRGFIIQNSYGIHFDQLMDEGGVHQSGIAPSILDNCSGITFTSPYWEQVRNFEFLKIGTSELAESFAVSGETCYGYINYPQALVNTDVSSVVVQNSAQTITYSVGTDYTTDGDSITVVSGGAITNGQTLKVSYSYRKPCRNIEIHGGTVGMADNASNDYNVYPIAVDKVDGLYVSTHFSTGAHDKRYSTTKYTRNIIDNTTASQTVNYGPHDNSLQLGRCVNYFSNSEFDLWLRGWPSFSMTRATISQETALVRSGSNAIRMTSTAAQTNPANISFIHNDSYLALKLRGKVVSVYSWVWIPNTSDYDNNNGLTQHSLPYLGIFFDGAAAQSVISRSTSATSRNAWNLLKVTAYIPTDATRIDISVYNGVTGTTTGSEYIVIDSVYVVEGSNKDYAIKNGNIFNADQIQSNALGGRMVMRSDSAPSDTDMTFEIGDQVWKFTASASASPGWVCTTGGIGGAAVFKTMANLAA
jgi:hypothetical protein